MRWGYEGVIRRPVARQTVLPFLDRTARRDRRFKWFTAATTALVCGSLIGATSAGRHAVRSLVHRTRSIALHWIGLEPARSEVEAALKADRARTVERTRESLTAYYRGAEPAMQRLFQAAGMDPDHCVIGSGRVSDGFLLSSRVFAADANGRSYRLLPNRRSIWLRQVTLHGGPFGLFLVPDTPEVREAAGAARAIVDEPSAQSTNSWGLRGPEPDRDAQARVVVLGDSFMMGMFNGDSHTPPLELERALADLWGMRVSVLNTGHIGYAPEQYFFSLKEYGERFRPHVVVVSVCPNDFGNGAEVMLGRGDEWAEAGYWLGEISAWCRAHSIPCVLAPVPCDVQVVGIRKDGRYPAPISDLFQGVGIAYCDGLDQFIDEHLRLMREGRRNGHPYSTSPLYNGHITDNHFSPAGAALWARIIARRIDLLTTSPGSGANRPARTGPTASNYASHG